MHLAVMSLNALTKPKKIDKKGKNNEPSKETP
jgi:hypothetical protein